MKQLSKKDSAVIANAKEQADALVETLTEMVGANDGLLHLHALDLQTGALAIQGKLRLIQTVSTASGE